MAIENRFASENYVSEALESYLQADDLNDYAKLDNLNDYAKLNDLNDYSKLSDLNDYAKLDALNDYATTEYVDSEVERILSLTERVKSWGAVQYYVRNGQAPYIFNIGDQLVCNSEQFGELVWDIIGFDHDTPTDSQYTHSMTLQLHTAIDNVERPLDAKEAYYCTDSILESGDYYWVYYSKLTADSSANYISITIPEGTTIPAGSILYGTLASAAFQPKDLSETYWSGKLTTSSTEPTTGTFLGEIQYHIGNGTYGRNDYKQSNIRFFLNGEDEVLNWTPQHPLDMPPTYVNDPGFLYGIDPEFRAVIGPVNKFVYDFASGQVEEESDLVFLPSTSELYGPLLYNLAGEQVVNLGEPYEYYINNTTLTEPLIQADPIRIKYNKENEAISYFLRNHHGHIVAATQQNSARSRVHKVNTLGAIGASYTNTPSTFLVPCCCIV